MAPTPSSTTSSLSAHSPEGHYKVIRKRNRISCLCPAVLPAASALSAVSTTTPTIFLYLAWLLSIMYGVYKSTMPAPCVHHTKSGNVYPEFRQDPFLAPNAAESWHPAHVAEESAWICPSAGSEIVWILGCHAGGMHTRSTPPLLFSLHFSISWRCGSRV